MTAADTDETLMLRYREGDVRAFEELYRRHSGGLYRFIAWRAPRRDWADEIAQDSWAALHAARARYQPEAAFRTYLYQIARNRLIDLVRQKEAQLAGDLDPAGDDGALFAHLAETAQDSDTPDAELERKRRIAALRAAIQSLPAEQKEALVLHQFSDMSLEDIAAVTAVPAETVKSRLRYAMKKLRTQLQGVAAEGEAA
jgi:RNA polymerase sigma factor (sigma-70 family)